MNQRLYEGRFLVSLTGAAVRQDEFRVRHSRVDWDRLCRLAQNHGVASILYLGTLGSWEPIPERWKEALFAHYVEIMRGRESFEESAREILNALDMNGIACTVLARGREKRFYPTPEMGGESVLRLFIPREDYGRAKGFLVDLGYETDRIFKNAGERMRRVPGLMAEIYYEMPFRPAFYRKAAAELLEDSRQMEGFQGIRELTKKGEFIFRMAAAAFHYVSDQLTIREMLDLACSHRDCRESCGQEGCSRENRAERLAAFRADSLAEDILSISYLWFGGKEDQAYVRAPENANGYDPMENRILTRGLLGGSETQPQARELAGAIDREIEEENRRELRRIRKEAWKKRWAQWKRSMAWVFPSLGYMRAIYPILGRAPFLLPVFWAARGGRMLLAGRKKDD